MSKYGRPLIQHDGWAVYIGAHNSTLVLPKLCKEGKVFELTHKEHTAYNAAAYIIGVLCELEHGDWLNIGFGRSSLDNKVKRMRVEGYGIRLKGSPRHNVALRYEGEEVFFIGTAAEAYKRYMQLDVSTVKGVHYDY